MSVPPGPFISIWDGFHVSSREVAICQECSAVVVSLDHHLATVHATRGDVVEYTARGRTESTSDAIAMARGLLKAEPAPDSYFYVMNLRYALALLVQDVEREAAS